MKNFILPLLFLPSLLLSGDWTLFHGNPAHTGEAAFETLKMPMKKLFLAPLGSRITASPVVRNDTVFIGTEGGKFFALNAKTGMELWSVQCGGPIRSTAAVGGGLVVFGCMDSVIRACHTDGRPAWQKRGTGPFTGSVNFAAGKSVFYAGDWGGTFFALDTLGRESWRFRTTACKPNPEMHFGCVYDSGKVYLPYGDNQLRQLSDTGLGFTTGWIYEAISFASELVLYKDLFFAAGAGPEWNEQVYAFRKLDGTRQSSALRVGASYSTPAVGNDRLFTCWNVANPLNSTYSNLGGSGGNWPVGTAGDFRSMSGMALSAGHAVMTTETGLFIAMDRTTGRIAYADTFAPPSLREGFRGSSSAPAISNGRVFFGTDAGLVICYGDTADPVASADKAASLQADPFLSIFPSPANPSTLIQYDLGREAPPAALTVFDLSGRKVMEANLSSRLGRVAFDGRNRASGAYVARLQCRDTRLTREFTLLK